jgi:formylglycine-generating enzyme
MITQRYRVVVDDTVPLPGGTFLMGSDRHYPEEAPARPVTVDGFGIDRYAVTNRDFAAFASATGYLTVAERPLRAEDFPDAPAENLRPGSLVFTGTPGPVDLRHISLWWTWTPGACWRRPRGPGSDLVDQEEHPVVHVAWEDAAAYARWAGKDLPTEAEWEYAARGGLDGAEYAWGDEQLPGGQYLANWWQGGFPYTNSAEDGFAGLAPAGSFPPNGFGLHEMTGNTWEWTADWWAERPGAADQGGCCAPADPERASYDPGQPQFRIGRKVIKGGSFLCADSYCQRYRPAARRPQMTDTGMSHIGFRCVSRRG